MHHGWLPPRAACAEIPNDNPDLHQGGIWRCETIGAPLTFAPPTAPSLGVSALWEEPFEAIGAEPAIAEPGLATFAGEAVASEERDAIRPGPTRGTFAEATHETLATATYETVAAPPPEMGSLHEVVLASPDMESSVVAASVKSEPDLLNATANAERAELAPAEPEDAAIEIVEELPLEEVVEEGADLHELAIAEAPEPRADEGPVLSVLTSQVVPVGTASDPPTTFVREEEEDDAPLDAKVRGDLESIEEPPWGAAPVDPFAKLLAAVEDAAAAHGAGEAELAALRALLGGARMDGMALPERATEALVSGAIAVAGARGLARGTGFSREVVAWQAILRGESDDFSACAAATLDEWAANVIARVLGNPARGESLRKELRRRGVAAFGLVADAA